MTAPPFCASCGAILPQGALKCPDCGAPLTAIKPRMGFSKASSAGLMLLILVALGFLQGFWIISNPDLPAEQQTPFSPGRFTISGNVTDESGQPVGGVNVTVTDQENRTAVTDPSGHYAIDAVDGGIIELKFNATGRAPTTVRAFVFQAETVDAQLVALGAPAADVNDGSYKLVRGFVQACGVFVVACGGLSLLGAIASYRKRNWGLALAGAIAGLFVLLPLSLLVGTIAIVFVVSGRAEFRKPA